MNSLQIILHCLPREIDEVERICNHLQRSSHFLEDGDKVILDFTLNVSDTLTDWSKSKLPKEFFVEKWKMMEINKNARKVQKLHFTVFLANAAILAYAQAILMYFRVKLAISAKNAKFHKNE